MAALSSNTDAPLDAPFVGLKDVTLFLIRFFTGFGLIWYQSWNQAKLGWSYMWEKNSWHVVDSLEKMGIGSAGPIAVTIVFLLLVCPFGILMGFLTRVNAGITLVVLGFVLLSGLILSNTLTSQTLFLYLGMCLTLAISGGGVFGADRLFIRKKAKTKDDSFMFR